MSAELEIVQDYQPARAVVRDVDGWAAHFVEVCQLATYVADTELVPKDLRGREAAVAAVMLYGREIGLPPMTALRTSFVINGRVGLAAETMRALVLSAGHEIIFRESTGTTCIVAGRRRGSDRWQEVTWNLDVARRAGVLTSQGPWQKYPRAMLKARASAELCRDLFPDVIGGYEAVEEIAENVEVVADPDASRTPVRRHRTGSAAVGSRQSSGSAKSAEDAPAHSTEPGPQPSAEPSPDVPVPLPGEAGYEQVGTDVSEPQAPADGDEHPRGDPGDWNRTASQGVRILTGLRLVGVVEREDRLALLSLILGRDVDTSKTISRSEASIVLDTLERIKASESLLASLRAAIGAGTVAEWLPVEDQPTEIGELAEVVPAPDPPVSGTEYVDVPLPTDEDEPRLGDRPQDQPNPFSHPETPQIL